MTIPYLHTSETKLLLQLKADLERHEGFREYAYADPESVLYKRNRHLPWGYKPARELGLPPGTNWDSGKPWTVGFGFTHNVTPDSRIARIPAERMLEVLILNQYAQLVVKLPWVKDANFVVKTTLVNMAFNMGLVGLLKFANTLRYIKEKNYKQAARNMELSLWYTQTGSRAKELVQRMRTQTIEPQHRTGDTING